MAIKLGKVKFAKTTYKGNRIVFDYSLQTRLLWEVGELLWDKAGIDLKEKPELVTWILQQYKFNYDKGEEQLNDFDLWIIADEIFEGIV